MDALASVLDTLRNFLPVLTTIAVVGALLLLFNFVLRRRWKGRANPTCDSLVNI